MRAHNIRRLLVLSCLVGLSLSMGCSLKMGRYVASHELLRDEVGVAPLRTSAWSPLADGVREGVRLLPGHKRNDVALAAAAVVGQQYVEANGTRFRQDCSGVARAIYAKAGLHLGGRAQRRDENDVSILYRWMSETGSIRRDHPQVGDLVFFDNTYDRNGDGQRNDPLSHVGIVEKILEDGTIVYIHHVSGGILRYRMNLEHPRVRRDSKAGTRLNHDLRRAAGDVPAQTGAELFRAFGSVPAPADEALWTMKHAFAPHTEIRSDS